MRRLALFVVLAQSAVVAAFAVALRSGSMPLGVPGEWEWQRLRVATEGSSMILGLVGLLLFAGFVAAGFHSLSRPNKPGLEGVWLTGLALGAILVQGVVQEGAPIGYGLSKWIIALHAPGSSGYYTVAKKQMADPRRFLADYPAWIEKQDALHIGTHPPGLFLVAKGMLSAMEANPALSRSVVAFSPPSVSNAIVAYRDSLDLPRADAAGLALTGALTLIACSLTVVPLYLLARSSLPAPAAWASAAFWPLVPSALLFQPTADTAFPLLSTSALALACWAGRGGLKAGLTLCFLAGLTLAVGMFFTLAYLPVGLVVALVLLSSAGLSWPRKAGLILATGAGFLLGTLAWWAATSANPFAIWWVNQRNHGRFYLEYPRSYVAWMLENPVELAIALGLPASVWALVGLVSPCRVPRVGWATVLVLAILTISGKNLSEVARLWLPLMPPLLVVAGWGFAKVGGRGWELAGSVALVGLQVLILEVTIQVVYPI
jgi:methylthioxylose transferase